MSGPECREPGVERKPDKIPNLVLRHIREYERQETRAEFAEAMMRVGERLGESVFPSERYVARLEDDDIKWPRPISDLGFSLPGRGNSSVLTANVLVAPARVSEGTEGDQSLDIVTPGKSWPASMVATNYAAVDNLFQLDEDRLISAARCPRRHDPGLIDVLADLLAAQRKTEDLIGATPLIEPVVAQLNVVTDLVMEARGDIRAQVLDIGSHWAQFAGWLHASVSDVNRASSFYGLALEWSTEADLPDMIATALNMRGHAAWIAEGNVLSVGGYVDSDVWLGLA